MTFPTALLKSSTTNAARTWQQIVARYQIPDVRRSVWQVINSFSPYIATWALAYLALSVSYWLMLPLAILAAGFLTRVFIILHDCGHGSFFKSQKVNNALGVLCGVFAFTPYFQWRHSHAIHHASSGNLDKRLNWELPITLTVKEYRAAPRWKQVLYRLYRHPLVLFGVAPTLLFVFAQRFVGPTAGRRERFSVHFTNLALLALFLTLGYWLGFKPVLTLQLTIVIVAATVGVWLFYIQHQFEDTYWERHGEWDFAAAALQGSSYFKLPKVLQWFTGNIGLHHIHHLNSRIPNYSLQRCHDENPEFQKVNIITLLGSLRCVGLKLWDEAQGKLVGWGHLNVSGD